MTSALLVIDMQRDFMPGGALSVPNGDLLIPKINRLMKAFPLVVATKDFHPKGHVSFASSHPGKKIGEFLEVSGSMQMLWPEHCVQESKGSDFAQELDTAHIHHVVTKGTSVDIDSYSAFFDNAHNSSTGLGEYLKSKGITKLFVCGVATDYCVLFSVLDAISLGFSVFVMEDVCGAVDLQLGDGQKAYDAMERKGACLIQSEDALALL
jgi:nicotinamidase/pyrazinamidase